MEAEQNQEVPEAVAETQEVRVEEKSEPKCVELVDVPPEMAPEQEISQVKTPVMENSAEELPAKEKTTEAVVSPAKPSEVAPEKCPAAESSEKPPEVEKSLEPVQQKVSEPQVQVNSELEKQEEEPAKDAESKPIAVSDAKPEELDKGQETMTKEDDKVQTSEAEGVQAELPKEAEPEQKEPELPLFFGWFLLPEEEERIKCATMDFLKTLDTLEAFKQHISEFTGEAEKEVDLEQYFQTVQPLHCTTKFCDYGKAEGAKEYMELQVVKDSFGNSYELSVTALIVTPRTFGARVALTETQMKLWPEGADKDMVPPALLPSVEGLPSGSRAHVTLGCSAGTEAVQTGLDLLEILGLQKEGKEGTQVEMEMGTLSYLDEGRWFLALREPITADTTFSSFSDDKPTSDQSKKDGEKKKKKCTIL